MDKKIYQKMAKLILTNIFLFVVFFVVLPTGLQAQDIEDSCGIGGIEGIDHCCGYVSIEESTDVISEHKNGIGEEEVADTLEDLLNSADVLEKIQPKCFIGEPKTKELEVDNETVTACTCELQEEPEAVHNLADTCEQFFKVKDSTLTEEEEKDNELIKKELEACIDCAEDMGGLYTAIGCIPLNFSNFITNFILQIGIGIAGMASLLCIIYSAFMIQFSQGDAEKLQTAREQLVSCVIGLLLIIFSIFILRFIGKDILRLPGFEGDGQVCREDGKKESSCPNGEVCPTGTEDAVCEPKQ
jgi:hypothetical protein